MPDAKMILVTLFHLYLFIVDTSSSSSIFGGFAPYESDFTSWNFSLDDIRRCTCVLPQHCIKGNAAFEINGLFDPRIARIKCMPFEVCCSKDDLLSGPKCGVSFANSERVTTLKPTRFAEWPWHVAIVQFARGRTLFMCSGVLIDSKHVLTVAHCLGDHHIRRGLFVRLGEWNALKQDELLPHIDIAVASVTTHAHFDRANLWNDIAVLKLQEEATFQGNIQPVCLPRGEAVQTLDCVVSGWGKSAFDNGSYSAVLKHASVQVISSGKCQAQLRKTRLGGRFRLHPSFLCAGGVASRSDSCTGDGGGGLFCRGIDGLFYLVGLVSWGVNCGLEEVPGVYVNVGRFVPWVEQVLRSGR